MASILSARPPGGGITSFVDGPGSSEREGKRFAMTGRVAGRVTHSLRSALCALLLLPAGPASPADLATLRGASGTDQETIAAFGDGQTLVVFAHQDDDLLWMFPFWPVTTRFLLSAYPAAPVFEDLVARFPPQFTYRQRWT